MAAPEHVDLPTICEFTWVNCSPSGSYIRALDLVITSSIDTCKFSSYTELAKPSLALKEMAIILISLSLEKTDLEQTGIKIPRTGDQIQIPAPENEAVFEAVIDGDRFLWRVLDYSKEGAEPWVVRDVIQIYTWPEETERKIRVQDSLLAGFPTAGDGIGEQLSDRCGESDDRGVDKVTPSDSDQRKEVRMGYALHLKDSVERLYRFLMKAKKWE